MDKLRRAGDVRRLADALGGSRTRPAAVEALKDLVTPQNVVVVVDSLARNRDEETADAAASVLRHLGAQAADVLSGFITSDPEDDSLDDRRIGSAVLLARMGPEHGEEPLLMLSRRSEMPHRMTAISCLGLLGTQRAIERIGELLVGDPEVTVRAFAAFDLGSRGRKPDVVRLLLIGLASDEAFVRAASADSLRELRDPEALESLRAAADDPNPRVRQQIAGAIRAIGGG